MTPMTCTHATQTAGAIEHDHLDPELGDCSAGPADSESSVAAAYLKQFKEMVNLIEQLPDTPELIGDILKWQPTTYQDYFNASAMPGRVSAADVYASLNRCVRQSFERVVDDLDQAPLQDPRRSPPLQDPRRSPPRYHDGDLRARR
jgi:hypothetical protein